MKEKEMITEKVYITPEIANKLLLTNTNNRNVSPVTIKNYVRQMLEGKWKLSPEPICIDWNGKLINGQHRLLALIKANLSFYFMCTKNCTPEIMNILDSGKNRTGGDVLSMNGYANGTKISSIIVKYNQLCNELAIIDRGGNQQKIMGFNNNDILNMYNKMPEFWQQIFKNTKNKLNINTPSYNGSIMAYLILEKKHKPELVFDFFNQLFTGDVKNDVIRQLREIILREGRVANFKLNPKERYWLIVKTWNYFIKNKTIKTLKYKPEEIIEFL